MIESVECFGDSFQSLVRTSDAWLVTLSDGSEHSGADAEEAYAVALLDHRS